MIASSKVESQLTLPVCSKSDRASNQPDNTVNTIVTQPASQLFARLKQPSPITEVALSSMYVLVNDTNNNNKATIFPNRIA